MSLPWVRLDSNIATHDKVLRLLAQKDGHRAFTLYICALGYAGAHGTDGRIESYALPVVHGTERLAALLVAVGLWEPDHAGDDKAWRIRNYLQRQELAVVAEAKRAAARMAGRKAACVRHHGPDCGCWRADGEASVVPLRGAR